MLRCTGKVAPVVISGNKELSQIDRASTAHTIRRRTIRYDIVYLTCGKKLTCSQISPPHEVIYSNSVTFKSGLEVTQDHWKWHHSIDHIRVPICLPLQLCLYLLPLQRYSASNIGVILKSGLGVVKGIENSTDQYSMYDFISVCHCNYCSILHHFRVIWVQNTVTLKSSSWVTEGHWKWHHSIDHIRVPICLPLQLWPYLVLFLK